MTDLYLNIAVALAIGLLIGLERGWSQREKAEGRRVAGIRTFALTGFLGGIVAHLASEYGNLIAVVALAGVALLAAGSVIFASRREEAADRGITTDVALLVTFSLGLLAGNGELVLAGASAVVLTLLLGLKPELHRWLEGLHSNELFAFLKLLVISVVILPALPDRGYGPWQALNPFLIWLMVVLISAISFFSYIAVKLVGTRKGLLAAGLIGGLTSSTAVAVSMGRIGRDNRSAAPISAAAGLASGFMVFPRLLILTAAFAPALAGALAPPLIGASLTGLLSLLIIWPSRHRSGQIEMENLVEPFDLKIPLRFGVLLAAIMLAAAGLQAWLGDSGLYTVSAIAGLSDVDAISLAAARNVARQGLDVQVASLAVLIAVFVNSAVKGAIMGWMGGPAMAWRAALGFGTAMTGGVLIYGAQLLGWLPRSWALP